MAETTNVDPSTYFTAVTPHDTNEITPPRALYIGTSGDVAVIGRTGAAVTLKAVPQGTVLPIRPKIVKSTGTTAADIVALY